MKERLISKLLCGALPRGLAGDKAAFEILRTVLNDVRAPLESRVAELEELLEEAREAVTALRGNMLVSHGTANTAHGVWFRGGDAVAQCDAIDAFLAKLEKRGRNDLA